MIYVYIMTYVFNKKVECHMFYLTMYAGVDIRYLHMCFNYCSSHMRVNVYAPAPSRTAANWDAGGTEAGPRRKRT